MDRRAFVGGGLAGLALAASGLEAERPQKGPIIKRPPFKLCHIRADIRHLTPAQLAAFKTGVSTMMARPASDPTSWSYQAAIHGSLASPTHPLWNSCEHGSIHFFSWHRLFLYYFERILRAASGSSSLTLPYWNWQAQRALPAPFVDTSAGNPLFTSHRSAAMNSGALLPTSSVSTTASFAETNFTNFSGQFEGTPHGSVHVSVGGWMGSVPTAGADPIFWLHHCNVDRLWERWLAQGGGRANPATAAWLNRSFTFYDVNGQQVTRHASDALKTCATLGYNYEVLRFVISPAILARLLPLTFVIAADAPAAAAERLTLAGPMTRAPIALGPVANRLGASRQVLLAFEGIRVRDPEGYYEVYLNPAKTEGLSERDPSYAGNLVFFGAPVEGQPMDHMAHQGGDRRVFDVTSKLADLRKRGLARGGELNVVLMLRLPEGGREPAKAEGVRAVVERVRLVAQ